MENEVSLLPQNVKNVLMEIGQNTVVFRLYLIIKQTNWDVFKSIGEPGCDIVLINRKDNRIIKIEVKTRQKLSTAAKNKNTNSLRFSLTKNEYENCNFAVCFWFEQNSMFIIPRKSFIRSGTREDSRYTYKVQKDESGNWIQGKEYLDAWNLIEECL